MLKKIISLLALTCILGMQTFGATFVSTDGNTKIPTSLTTKDFNRFLQVVQEVSGQETKLINMQKVDAFTYAVRLRIGADTINDYVITTISYQYDAGTQKVVSLPFESLEDGNNKYGKNWYYFGLISDVGNEICGFGLAERVKRWVDWNDLSYAGTTESGKTLAGYYSQPCSEEFQY